ncbi:MAG: fimbrial biosis outer rane usher protein, partial [Novosphingobium sp.]|nr:fimbrial biosis outer rane usher protein [Novosphingobium sp.]
MRRPSALNTALAASLAAIAWQPPAQADEAGNLAAVEFNSDFLQGAEAHKVDLGRFAKSSAVLPGEYLVDLDLNGQWLSRALVRFVVQPGQGSAAPCIDNAMLQALGVVASPALRAAVAGGGCADLRELAKDASAEFDQAALRLSVSIPQALLSHRARGYVGPESWDRGVPSATIAYDTSVFQSNNGGSTTTSVYAGV